MILDSNILIYACSDAHPELRDFIQAHTPSVSVVTKIETLGYHLLTSADRIHLEAFFNDASVLAITDSIADVAIQLRQKQRMSLGDSLIAATCLVWDETLVTHNVSDFKWIDGLDIVDPLR